MHKVFSSVSYSRVIGECEARMCDDITLSNQILVFTWAHSGSLCHSLLSWPTEREPILYMVSEVGRPEPRLVKTSTFSLINSQLNTLKSSKSSQMCRVIVIRIQALPRPLPHLLQVLWLLHLCAMHLYRRNWKYTVENCRKSGSNGDKYGMLTKRSPTFEVKRAAFALQRLSPALVKKPSKFIMVYLLEVKRRNPT